MKIRSAVVMLAAVLIESTLCAANSYVVPCYVNAVYQGASDVGVGNFSALNISADGRWLRYATDSGDGAIRLKEVLELSGTATLRVRGGYTPVCPVSEIGDVYKIGNVLYSVYAEGTTIKLRRESDQALFVAVNDPTHLNSTVQAVKMSQLDSARPRFYALLASGDIVVYTYRPETGDSIYATTLLNSDLITKAGADVSASALEVTADGAKVILGFGGKLAVFTYSPSKWIYYDAGMAGNPTLSGDNVNCISDGNWVLAVSWSNGKIYVGVTGATASTQGDAYRCGMGAEYLDLSTGYCYRATDNARFTIAGLVRFSLGYRAGVKLPRVFIVTPFIDGFWQGTKGWTGVEGAFEEIVIDSSVMNWWSSWTNWTSTNRRLVFNLPSVTQFDSYSLYGQNYQYWGEHSNAADWMFAGLTVIKDHACSYCKFSGILTLPSVQTIETEAFAYTPNLTEVKLSAEKKNLTSIADKSFYQTSGSIRKVTIGGANGLRMSGSQIFAGNPLKEVTFTGAVPTFDANATAWPDTSAETMVFVVPDADSSWQAVLSGKVVRTLTEVERKAFHAANPDLAIPQMVVDKSVFATGYNQLLAYAGSGDGHVVEVEYDDFFGDRVEVTSDWAVNADGTFPPGATVTFRAVPDATGTFVSWYGDVPAGSETNAEITVAVNEDLWLYARITHPWTLASDKATMSNGNFTVNVTEANDGAHTLKVGLNEPAGLYASTDWGSGVLDLGGTVLLADDSTPWSIIAWGTTGSKGGTLCGEKNGKGNATTFISPLTAILPPYGQYFNGAAVAGGAVNPSTVIMDMPKAYTWFEGWTCGGGSAEMKRFIIKMPMAERFNGAGFFWPQSLCDTKADWWDLNALSYIHSEAWNIGNEGVKIRLSGKLTLPSMTDIRAGESTSSPSPFANLANVTAYEIGSAAHPVTSVCSQAFAGNSSLQQLTIYNDSNITFGNNPFMGGRIPGDIVFLGEPPADAAAFAGLLSDVTAAAHKPVVIRIPKLTQSWLRASYLDFDLSAAEKSEAAGNVVAVYRGGATAPNGKALVVADKLPRIFSVYVR